jgi:hypothetical protein
MVIVLHRKTGNEGLWQNSSTLAKVGVLGGLAILLLCCGGVLMLFALKVFSDSSGTGSAAQAEMAKRQEARQEEERKALFVQRLEEGKKKIARSQALELTKACDTYNINHGQWPPNLEVLLLNDGVGGPYLKDPGALVDPWNQPYQYDPQGPNNDGLEPDIWSLSPHGPIGNWPGSRKH